MIASFELLDSAECARLERRIKDLREYWIPRAAEPASFFTLGATSYLDGAAEYGERSRRLNPVLRDNFEWIYTRLTDFLSRRLRGPVTFAEGLAHPGFHVWLTPSIFIRPEASVHFDLQYLRAWPEDTPNLDFTRPLSFTLPIRLPRRGGGLNVWDVTYDRYRAFYERIGGHVQPMDVTTLLERMRHPYTPGALAMHSGHLLHQVGEIDEVTPGDERITLQGHALCQNGEWKIYW